MNVSLLNGPAWSSSYSSCANNKFDNSDVHHASESSIWWESMESLETEEEEDISDPDSKTDPMIQISTPATFSSYGISQKFFDS